MEGAKRLLLLWYVYIEFTKEPPLYAFVMDPLDDIVSSKAYSHTNFLEILCFGSSVFLYASNLVTSGIKLNPYGIEVC